MFLFALIVVSQPMIMISALIVVSHINGLMVKSSQQKYKSVNI